jgi:hypothetical protein
MTLFRSLTDPAVPLGRRLWRALLLVLLLAACVYRVALIVRYNPVDNIWSDPQRHWEQGIDTLRYDPMSVIDPILFQVYIGALAKLTLKLPVLVAYFTALLSLVGPWLWYRFLRELTHDRDASLAGWVVLAALPSWSAIYSYFMQETLMLPLLGAALWTTWRARRKGDLRSFLWATAAWILAGLTRGICLPLGFLALAWTWLSQPGKLPRAVASSVLAASIFVPLSIRSEWTCNMIAPHGIGTMVQLYHRSGAQIIEMEFRRQGAYWKYGFASPAVLRSPFEPFFDWKSLRTGTVTFSVDMDHGSRDWKKAMDSLPPWTLKRAAALTGENLILLFFSQTWPDTNTERFIGVANSWERWLWAPLTLAALALTLARWRRQRDWLLPVLLFTWFAVQGVFPLCVNEGRYRKPFEGLLVAQCAVLLAGARRSQAVETVQTLEAVPAIPGTEALDVQVVDLGAGEATPSGGEATPSAEPPPPSGESDAGNSAA